MADLTSEAKVPFLPLNATPQYMLLRHMPTCMLHADIMLFFIPWLRLWHGGHVEKWSLS